MRDSRSTTAADPATPSASASPIVADARQAATPASRRRSMRVPRFRLPRRDEPFDRPGPAAQSTSHSAEAAADGPIVFFIPARNEGPRLAAVIARIPPAIDGIPVTTLVIDDGSSDDTVEVARRSEAEVVSHPVNRGLGAAVRTGFETAVSRNASAVAFCDGDGEYDPSELENLLAPIRSGEADYVVGSRFLGDIEWMRPHRRLGNLVLTRWVRWVVRQRVTDGQSGFRVVSGEAARTLSIAHDYNYAQVLTIDLIGHGARYAEVPISYRFRSSGRSFVRLGRYLRQVVPTVHRQLASIHDRGRQSTTPSGVFT